jgi:SAM-dependent methyltransferase
VNTVRPDWFLEFASESGFDPWYSQQPQPEDLTAEVDFLVKQLAVKPGCHLLDVPCGKGSHARILAGRGFAVTGIDVNKRYIEEARAQSLLDRTDGLLSFIHDDMRNLAVSAAFEGGYCLGDSFGYFGPDDTELFIRGFSRSLKRGAKLIIDTSSVAEVLIPNLKESDKLEAGGLEIEITRKYHADSSCLESRFTIKSATGLEVKNSLQWVFSTGELSRMLGKNGFAVDALYGSIYEERFDLGSERLLMVALKT